MNAGPARIASLTYVLSDTSESGIAVANCANTVAVTASLIASLTLVLLGSHLHHSDTAFTRVARTRSRLLFTRVPLFFFV